jgi:hypothetical protein
VTATVAEMADLTDLTESYPGRTGPPEERRFYFVEDRRVFDDPRRSLVEDKDPTAAAAFFSGLERSCRPRRILPRLPAKSRHRRLAFAGIVVGFGILALQVAIGTAGAAVPLHSPDPSPDHVLAHNGLIPPSGYPLGFTGQGPGTGATQASFFASWGPQAARCLGVPASQVDAHPVEAAGQQYDRGNVWINDTVDVFPTTAAARADEMAAVNRNALRCAFKAGGPSLDHDLGPGLGPGEHDNPPTALGVSAVGDDVANEMWSMTYSYQGKTGTYYTDWITVQSGRSESNIWLSNLGSAVPTNLIPTLVQEAKTQLVAASNHISAPSLLSDACRAISATPAFRVQGHVSSGRSSISIDVYFGSAGDVATMTVDGNQTLGTIVDGHSLYLKGNKTLWLSATKNANIASLVAGRWLNMTSDKKEFDGLTKALDRKALLSGCGTGSSPAYVGQATVNGIKVSEVRQISGRELDTIDIQNGPHPRIVRLTGGPSQTSGDLLFSDYGLQPHIAAPPGAVPISQLQSPTSLAQARAGFVTHLTSNANADTPAPVPPRGVMNLVEYPSPVGNLVAYLTPDPGDGKRHPAIIWISGGDTNTIGDVWTPEPADDDQTASAYRKAGIVMMYPSQRGGNMNPGRKEGFLGECDDVLAAEKYLAALPYVDPSRIYLGGHSTGGTLVLLIAELPNPFRAVFSFGPVANPVSYDTPDYTPFNTKNREEVLLRSPGAWLTSVHVPTWVLEGTQSPSNIADLRLMEHLPHDRDIHFVPLTGLDHFGELRPINAQIAQDILADTNSHKAFSLRLQWPPRRRG